jgi:hypothetical protein
MLLDEMILHDDEPRHTGWLYNDNLGAIYLSKNQHVSVRTKHIDIRVHYVRELQEQGVIKILFERSENLVPDMINKNLPEEEHLRHAQSLLRGTMICWREDVGEDGLRRLAFVQRNPSTVRANGTKGSSKTRSKTESSTVTGPDELSSKDSSQNQGEWITVTNRGRMRRRKL